MNKILSLIGACFFISALFSQDKYVILPTNPESYIDVDGYAELLVEPDEIYVEILLEEKVRGRNKVTVEQLEDSLKLLLKSIQIDLKRLSLSGANAEYVSIPLKSAEIKTSKRFQLKLANATEAKNVFEVLDAIKPQQMYISRVNSSVKDSLYQVVLAKAVKTMKHKAELMVSGIGDTLGKPIFITEAMRNANNYDGLNFGKIGFTQGVQYKTFSFKDEAFQEPTNITYQKITISAKVNGRFEIL